MLFETLCGISGMMQTPEEIKIKPWNHFVHVLHTECIDFCMKFKGYPYRTVTEADAFVSELKNSIDRGYPVIAFVKDAAVSPVCVLIGYDGDTVMMADLEGGVQNPPDRAPAYDEIEQMLIITGRGESELGLIDGFKNIESTLSDVLGCGIWDEYYQSFEFWGVLEKEPIAAFGRAKTLCWNFDRCHDFSEGLLDLIPTLEDGRVIELIQKINEKYNLSHDVQWAVIGLYDCRDWNKRGWESKENGMCMFAQWALKTLRENDEAVLGYVREIIKILETPA